jgi:Domain of unknown function (DUF4157)
MFAAKMPHTQSKQNANVSGGMTHARSTQAVHPHGRHAIDDEVGHAAVRASWDFRKIAVLAVDRTGKTDVTPRVADEQISSAEGTPKLHTTAEAAEAQADDIARRVAVPEQARPGQLPFGMAERLGREVGGDFRRVRVHSDEAAANRAARYGAAAMSEGRDLFFAAGRWRPNTRDGAFLAAHEAVHAAQQQFAERGVQRGEGRYFKKDGPPPKADPRDVFAEIKKRAPDLAVFVSVKTINDAMAGNSNVEGPAVAGGTSGTDVHEWHVSITLSQVHAASQTASQAIVSTKKTKQGQLVKHVIPIFWGTFSPFGSGQDYEDQGKAAEQAKTLPPNTKRGKDFAFELKVAEPLVHELLHARIIMETDSTYSGGPHTQLAQGYLDMIGASQSPKVKKQRDSLRLQIGVMAGLHDRKPTNSERQAVVDTYDEFLVHEKFDSQKVFDLMGRSNVTNPTVAKAYAETVASRLTGRFGDVTVSDPEERTQLAKLVSAATDYYDAIDGALAGANPASQPTNAPSTATPPGTSAPSKPSTK